jgi:hypothetical protein
MTTPDLLGTIPQSQALAEATPDSLSELFSRDPTSYGPADWDRVIAEMRTQRKRWQEAEASGATRAPKGAKVKPVVAVPVVDSAADLGL